MIDLIHPEWPAPARVRAAATTRLGGVSEPPYDSLNLGLRTDDLSEQVMENRRRLLAHLEISRQPAWLKQVHGNHVVDAAKITEPIEADAAYTTQTGTVCVVMTADCLPVLICDRAGSCVAAIHAGWRGLAGEVIAACANRLPVPADQLMAWLGPAIGPAAFEVGPEVRAVFLQLNPANHACFQSAGGDRWLADIYAIARLQLQALGVSDIYGGGWCTVSDSRRFFSYRRDRDHSGRMASLIWLTHD